MSQGPVLRKYGVQTTINFVLFEVDGVDFRVDAADSGANCTIMKDEGAEATCTNDFTDEGTGYSLVLDATEMSAARIVVYVIDAATKVWLDTSVIIETYGNASAMHAMDFDEANGTQFTEAGGTGDHLTAINLPNQTMNITGSITGNLSGSVGSVTGAVGSVVGNVDGTINGLTAIALADMFDTDSGTNYAGAVAGSVVKEMADNAGGSSLTEAGIADAVWDELLAGHVTSDSAGELLNDWQNGGRLDLILDIVAADVVNIDGAAMRGTDGANTTTPPTAAAIVNEWESQSQADPTGFHVNVREWLDVAVTLSANDNPDVNIDEISDDQTAPANLELQYDTTGLSGDTFPATQAQVGAIGSSSGGSLSFAVEADNASSAIKGVSKTGTETGTFANTEADDGTYHVITHATNVIDWIYQIDVGGGRTGSRALFRGYLTSANDTISVQAYDFVGADWETRGVISGQGGTNNLEQTFSLLSKHTGSGSDIGKVLIRFITTGTSPVLNVDELLVEAISIGQTVGYANGRIWINTVTGTAGTEPHVNGVVEKPCLTLADALTLSANPALNISDFQISSNSTLTLVQDFNNANLYGVGYTLDFAGFDCAGTHFYHASPVDGIVTSANNADHVDILDSIVNDVTVDDSHFTNCSFTGTVTLGSVASNVRVINCRSVIAGASTPVFNFGTGAVNHNMTIAHWQNGIEIQNFNVSGGGTDLLSISGTGQLIVNANCDGGTINLRGQWKITDNSGGAVTIVQDDVATKTGSLTFTVANQVDANMLAISGDTAAADNLEESATAIVFNTAKAGTLSTTQMSTNLTEATDDHYIGRTVIWTTGVLANQASDITDYVGTNGVLTFSTVTDAPSAGDAFVIV